MYNMLTRVTLYSVISTHLTLGSWSTISYLFHTCLTALVPDLTFRTRLFYADSIETGYILLRTSTSVIKHPRDTEFWCTRVTMRVVTVKVSESTSSFFSVEKYYKSVCTKVMCITLVVNRGSSLKNCCDFPKKYINDSLPSGLLMYTLFQNSRSILD